MNSDKISKSTYEYFAKILDDEIVEREGKQKTFTDIITSQIVELEKNTEKMEVYLTEIELKHIAEEVDADLYEWESKILNLGIEKARRELNNTRIALSKIFPESALETVTRELSGEKVKEVEEVEEVPAERTVEALSLEEGSEELDSTETTTEETTGPVETYDYE